MNILEKYIQNEIKDRIPELTDEDLLELHNKEENRKMKILELQNRIDISLIENGCQNQEEQEPDYEPEDYDFDEDYEPEEDYEPNEPNEPKEE